MRTLLPLLLLTACDEERIPEHEDDLAPIAVDFVWSDDPLQVQLMDPLNSVAIRAHTDGAWSLRVTTTRQESPARTSRGSHLRRSAPAHEPSPASAAMGLHMDISMDGSAQSGPIRAGSTDDNASFSEYLDYLSAGYQDLGGVIALDVSERHFIQVQDPLGAPLAGARVSVQDADSGQLLWTGHTYGDGRLPFYPSLYEDSPESSAWLVQAEHQGTVQHTTWDGSEDELSITLDATMPSGLAIDVCFIIDTTGSMSDEIDRIKQTLMSVTAQLRGEQEVDLRYGAVLYRDISDSYLTKMHPFTDDLSAFNDALQEIQAGGGGDQPESLNQGLAVATSEMAWREGAAKVAFLIADAPPHMDYPDDRTYDRSALAAIHSGIRVHTVAASGLDDTGSMVFRQVAQLSRGKFIFIEYGSTAESADDHGVTGTVSSNNLDDIIKAQIQSEIQGWGRAPQELTQR
jgi:hypothetical protein